MGSAANVRERVAGYIFPRPAAAMRHAGDNVEPPGGIDMPDVNYLAVIAAAVATLPARRLWYSPALFGKVWQREAGVSEEQMKNANMAMIFGLTFVLSLIAAWVFALFLGPRPPMALGLGAGFSAGCAGSPPASASITFSSAGASSSG
jgi:hypothetical protein